MKTTQRAYTMRLMGIDDSGKSVKQSPAMKALWDTHNKVNAGIKVAGNWLLTLRGGVLPNERISEENNDECKMLALCWFTVESPITETEQYRLSVVSGRNTLANPQSMEQSFYEALSAKGVPAADHSKWWDACKDALLASIRSDSCWVQRWKMFEDEKKRFPQTDVIREVLKWLFGDDFLEISRQNTGEEVPKDGQENSDDPSKKGRNICSKLFGQGAKTDFGDLSRSYMQVVEFVDGIVSDMPQTLTALRNRITDFRMKNEWGDLKLVNKKGGLILAEPKLSNNGPSNKARKNWELMLNTLKVHEPDKDLSSVPGNQFVTEKFWVDLKIAAEREAKKKEKNNNKGSIADAFKNVAQDAWLKDIERAMGSTYGDSSSGVSNTEYFRFVVGHAMVSISQIQSFLKNAEDRRAKADINISEAKAKLCEKGEITDLLDDYLSERAELSGAMEEMSLSKAAMQGWKDVISDWKDVTEQSEEHEQERVNRARRQGEAEKFGDINLFTDMARNQYRSVWLSNGKVIPEMLENFAALKQAERYKRHYKVPSYRHPDPVVHPIFCQFGISKPGIEFIAPHKSNTHPCGVTLTLLDGKKNFNWHSTRLRNDLGFEHFDSSKAVPRVDRMGLRAAGYKQGDAVVADGVRDTKKWNGRLEVYRDDLHKMRGNSVPSACGQLRWFLTFSPQLTPRGPFWEYIKKPKIKEIIDDVHPFRVSERNGSIHNTKGKSLMERVGVGVLPGIRVMGVDIGHRFGAVCSIWEQVSSEDVVRIAKRTGDRVPEQHEVSFRCVNPEGKKTDPKKKKSEMIFRKVSNNGWAQLMRQFPIRLPGETGSSRSLIERADNNEREYIKQFCEEMGYNNELKENFICPAQLAILKIARSALKRHGNLMKIYHAMRSDERYLPGGGRKIVGAPEDRINYLQSVLPLWHDLAGTTQWKCHIEISQLWEQYARETALPKEKPKILSEEIKRKYSAIAKQFVSNGELEGIGEKFKQVWELEDKTLKKWLPRIAGWVAWGRRIDNPHRKLSNAEARQYGGVSLQRIAALGEVSKLQRAFAQRPTPKELFHESAEGDRHGKSVREKMEMVRKDRLKKLAGAIMLSSMGLVPEHPHNGDYMSNFGKGVREGDRFKPVHVVAIEDLDSYKTSELHRRRENRMLMSWSAAELKKYLQDSCHLYGIFLQNVPARYTSRFCSRCGAPGVRCEDVPLHLFKSGFWQKQTKAASDKTDATKTERDKYLTQLSESIENGKYPKQFARIPMAGGEFFVCSNQSCKVRGGLQADFNAAANIALRAMIDHAGLRIWQFVSCENGKLDKKKFKDSSLQNITLDDKAPANHRDARSKGGGYTLFRDISSGIPDDLKDSKWMGYEDFFKETERKIIQYLSGIKK